MAQTIKDVVTWLKQWYYTEDEVDDLLDEKQDSLVSGTNIKTINNNSLLGSGNINIQGSGGDGSLTKITLADGYDLYVNDNNHLAMLHIHKSVSLSGQWNTLLASAIPLAYRPLGWLGIPNNDDTIIVGDDGGIYYNNFSGSSSKTLDNQVNWFFVGGTSSYNVALTSNKSILSYYDSESAILTATVTDGSDNPVADVTVEFFKGSTSMGTAQTNSSGVATKTYNSQGSGDLSFTASVGTISSETYELHDIYFYREQEYSLTKSSGSALNQAFDSNVALTFPSHCEISFEIYSTGGTASNEHRLFIQPNSLYVVGTQPSKALFVQNNGRSGSNGAFGYRNSTTNTFGSNFSGFSTNEYHNVKFVRNGTSVTCYFDDAQKGSGTISFFDDYTDWNIYFHLWNNGTMKIQNIQIKPL